ncbi:MAG: DUF1361 domain-containing protein [Ferruginibacter sp.]
MRSFNRLLAIFFMFIAALIAARIIYSGSIRYIFMSWNIFLGWIPYVLSCFFVDYINKAKWKQLILFFTWMLFFPNALYIVTDLIHLDESTNVPLWFDAILIFASSFVGLMMAFVSLRKLEFMLAGIFKKRTVNYLIPVFIFLGSFGVYLGRFQRWNSWDILHAPFSLALDIAGYIISPVDNIKTWAIIIILTALYSLLYFFIKVLPVAFADKK